MATHLIQLAGFVFIAATLLLLGGELEAGQLARIASGGIIATVGLAAGLQAVDGIALKNMVDLWSAAPAAQKESAFHAAFAVRQVGLASVLMVLSGATTAIYGLALLLDPAYRKWIGGIAVAGGALMAVAGIVTAHTASPAWQWRSKCRRV